MPTSAQDKLDLAAKMVRQAKADGVPLREVTQQYEDADLAEAMEYTEDRARHERSLARRADAAERAVKELPKARLDDLRIGMEAEPLVKRLQGKFEAMGIPWGTAGVMLDLHRKGEIQLKPEMREDVDAFWRLWDESQENEKVRGRLVRDEPERARELRDAAIASMADPTFGGLPTE